jgi:hypothetical protein
VQQVHVAAYIEELQRRIAAPSVKLQLAGIRMLFDWLVVGQVMPMNPAAAVRGPRHSVKAWIPFNAWMTNTFGDLRDSELLDNVKGGGNDVYNRIVPMLTWRPAQVRRGPGSWQDQTQEAEDFRLKIKHLHRLLQS